MLDSLKAQAEDTFKAYAANHWDTDSESLIGMDYVGDYILTPKEDSFWVDNDIVTLVYMVLVCRSLFIRPHSGNSTPSIFTIFIGTTTINQMMNPIGIPAWMRLAV